MRRARSSSEVSEKQLPRAFNVFWAGQGLSALGDAMTLVAMPLVVLAESGSVAQMGRLTAVARVGGLIATAVAGFVVDRWAPRRVMLLCEIFRCVLMSLIPLAWNFNVHPMWLVFVVGIGAALAQGVFYVGHVSLIVELVGRARVSLANSRIEGSIALAYVFGPLVAGVLSARWGPASVLSLDSATFLVSVLALAAIAGTPAPPLETLPPTSRSTLGLAGLRFVRAQPELWRLTIFVALAQFFTAAIVDIFIFRLKHDLRQSDTGTGLTFAIASVAAVLAAVSTPWLRAKVSFHRLWVAAVVLQGLALVLGAPSRSFAVMAAAAAVYMAAMTSLLICQASLRQELTPQHLLGRVTSSYLVLTALPMPVGALLATTLAARFSAGHVQAGLGVGLLLTAACAAVSWSQMSRNRTD